MRGSQTRIPKAHRNIIAQKVMVTVRQLPNVHGAIESGNVAAQQCFLRIFPGRKMLVFKQKGPGDDFSVCEQNRPDRASDVVRNESLGVHNTFGGLWGLGTSSLSCLRLLVDWICSQPDYQIRSDPATGGSPPWQDPSPPGPNPLTLCLRACARIYTV